MRVAAYATVSTIAAAVVGLKAYLERPNFYSSSVALAHSNASVLILLNFGFVCFYFAVWGLILTVFGRLRLVETEAITEKAWASIIETMIAMAMFRDDIGAWFMVIFCLLLAGHVWEWIVQSRVEFLEQQHPSTQGLYHFRLTVGLLMSVIFATEVLNYSIDSVLDDPRPGVMVMFAFEFALLSLSSVSLLLRYVITVREILVIRNQIKRRVEQEKERIVAERRGQIRRTAEYNGAPVDAVALDDASYAGDHITEADVDTDVPGWEEKGRWIFGLDLTTDFFRLILYLTFFFVLVTFHGLPIHILRDMYLTINSFCKRLSDFFRYYKATKDMNTRYPDATAQDLRRDNTCIICREEMHPWNPETDTNVRLRAKKLRCGHVLHFHCLRSWLERQQVCPTCRRSVLAPATEQQANGQGNDQHPPNPQEWDRRHGHPQEIEQRRQEFRNNQNQNRDVREWRLRLGPIHLNFAARGLQGNPGPRAGREPDSGALTRGRLGEGGRRQVQGISVPLHNHLDNYEVEARREIRSLQNTIIRIEDVRSVLGASPRVTPIERAQLPDGLVVPESWRVARVERPAPGLETRNGRARSHLAMANALLNASQDDSQSPWIGSGYHGFVSESEPYTWNPDSGPENSEGSSSGPASGSAARTEGSGSSVAEGFGGRSLAATVEDAGDE